nr:MAG TPA: hypothetical protein [Caudoviricetes sp.]
MVGGYTLPQPQKDAPWHSQDIANPQIFHSDVSLKGGLNGQETSHYL